MRHQSTSGHEPDDPDNLNHALLSILVCDQPGGLWSLAELDRMLATSAETRTGEPPSHVRVEDAVTQLYSAGLVHRIGHYVFASRAAFAAERLQNC